MTQPSAQERELFDEGVAAARRGDRIKSRDSLTRLLRTDKNNEEAWLWMSSVVDTDRERIYCLNTAMKLNPQSKGGLRGLAILGALPLELRPQPITGPEIGGDGETTDPVIQVQRRRLFRLRRSRRLEFVMIALVVLLIAAVSFVFVGNRISHKLRKRERCQGGVAEHKIVECGDERHTPHSKQEAQKEFGAAYACDSI